MRTVAGWAVFGLACIVVGVALAGMVEGWVYVVQWLGG